MLFGCSRWCCARPGAVGRPEDAQLPTHPMIMGASVSGKGSRVEFIALASLPTRWNCNRAQE
jgi:hypothetical protein